MTPDQVAAEQAAQDARDEAGGSCGAAAHASDAPADPTDATDATAHGCGHAHCVSVAACTLCSCVSASDGAFWSAVISIRR